MREKPVSDLADWLVSWLSDKLSRCSPWTQPVFLRHSVPESRTPGRSHEWCSWSHSLPVCCLPSQSWSVVMVTAVTWSKELSLGAWGRSQRRSRVWAQPFFIMYIPILATRSHVRCLELRAATATAQWSVCLCKQLMISQVQFDNSWGRPTRVNAVL